MMQDISPDKPCSINNALGSIDNDALMTIAAFMLSAGARISARRTGEEILTMEDLDPLGLSDWWLFDERNDGQLDFVEFERGK